MHGSVDDPKQIKQSARIAEAPPPGASPFILRKQERGAAVRRWLSSRPFGAACVVFCVVAALGWLNDWSITPEQRAAEVAF